MSYEIMPPHRGSNPISRSRTWGLRPRLSHNTASRFKKNLCITTSPEAWPKS